mmetsp:Transcript_22759/g.29469  ORF Transcript_22759/g.29469 Transcript_22759/m.29469 type:complete len:106 (+) Transcript_22759:122-439(+)
MGLLPAKTWWKVVFYVLVLSLQGAWSFQIPSTHRKASALSVSDPTKGPVPEVANVIQNVLTNSPLNKGKLLLVKFLAGPYDEKATRAKLDEIIVSSPVVMLSFTT